MNIGLITFHKSHNCGSILQAYALKKTIEDLGHTCKIIDFTNEGQKRMYSVLILPKRFKDVLRDGLYVLFFVPMYRHALDYKKYINKIFDLDGKEYHTSEELKKAGIEKIMIF